ncbi:MAG: Rrf2 family transcriptional regulator, partial [Bdellovibrionota bacterium]
MIRISKLTDYGILLLTTMARDPGCTMFTARDLAERTRLPQPTVGKLLKDLSKGNFLASERGMRGGYRLSRGPGLITVA